MKRYAKLKRVLNRERQYFLAELALGEQIKLWEEQSRPPEGQSVAIDPDEYHLDGLEYNFLVVPHFAVPAYMSVNKNSPTFLERSAQEKEAIRQKLERVFHLEHLSFIVQDPFTNDVRIRVRV